MQGLLSRGIREIPGVMAEDTIRPPTAVRKPRCAPRNESESKMLPRRVDANGGVMHREVRRQDPSPRSRLDKLGVKPGARVSVLGIGDAEFRRDLAERTADVSIGRAKRDSDVVFVAMEKTSDLARLERLRASIKRNGAIWVVWPKGRREFREDDVRAAGPGMGLVDVKVVAFSDTLSALKMVIPVKER